MRRAITSVVSIAAVATAAAFFVSAKKVDTPPPSGIVLEAVVVEAYDGDTVTVRPVLPEMRVRLIDCWAAELRGTSGDEKARAENARAYIRGMVPGGTRVSVHIPTTGRMTDSLTFGRVLAHIWVDIDGDGRPENIAEEMISAGHATRYK